MNSAIKELQQLDYDHRRRRYPNAPPHAIPMRSFRDSTANGLTACISTWLEIHGHYVTRINTTGRKLKDTTVVNVLGQTKVMPGKWIPGTTRKGTADIHAIINGRHVSIEVKVGRDRMSQAQHKTKQAIEDCGGLYVIAIDFESFHNWYSEISN